MTREDILKSPEYWIAQIQILLYNCAEKYMRDNNMNRSQLAEKLGVSKGYISQLLNGDYDHRLSKLVELSLAFGVIPKIDFKPIEEVINEDRFNYNLSKWTPAVYNTSTISHTVKFGNKDEFENCTNRLNQKIA